MEAVIRSRRNSQPAKGHYPVNAHRIVSQYTRGTGSVRRFHVISVTPKNRATLRSRPLHSLTRTRNDELRQRLEDANDYFKRKAADVLNDEHALGLLCDLYETVVIDISEFDSCLNGISLSKLTAANFCEVGAKVIFITASGRRFVESIDQADV